MDLAGFPTIKGLVDLLNPKKDGESDSEDEQPVKQRAAPYGPGDIGGKKKQESTSNTGVETSTSKSIWDEEEIPDGGQYDDIYDTRPQPEYEIHYKQAVTSEDMFLQMGSKTPATASCEHIVVKISLPDTVMADVDLDVKPKFLSCRSPKFKLGLHLPHPVNEKSGNAQWDAKKQELAVTLKLEREYDFMNY